MAEDIVLAKRTLDQNETLIYSTLPSKIVKIDSEIHSTKELESKAEDLEPKKSKDQKKIQNLKTLRLLALNQISFKQSNQYSFL